MTVTIRSYLTAGVAAVAASAVVMAPLHVSAPTSISLDAVRLSAAVQPLIQPANAAGAVLGVVDAVTKPLQGAKALVSSSPTVGVTQAAVAATQSAGDTVMNVYNAVEPWVQWGFSVAAWAVGYVPYVGYLGSQINIAYDFGETLVQSWVQSFAYLLEGNFSAIGPTLVNGVSNAFSGLVQNEIAWISGFLPPLPPIPPFSAAAAQTSTFAAPALATRSAPQPSVTNDGGTPPQPVTKVHHGQAVLAQTVADAAAQDVAAAVHQVKQFQAVAVPSALREAASGVQTSLLSVIPTHHDSGSDNHNAAGSSAKPDHNPAGKKLRHGQSDSAD
jgi:hypothetical protein